MTLLVLSIIVPLKLLLPRIEPTALPAPAEARLTPMAYRLSMSSFRFSLVKLELNPEKLLNIASQSTLPNSESFRIAANSWLISRNAISLNERVLLVTIDSN